jgi:predicted ATP-dependent serine protease
MAMTPNAYICPGCGASSAFHTVACRLCGTWVPARHVPDRQPQLDYVQALISVLVIVAMIATLL